jgi:hypothetical protein
MTVLAGIETGLNNLTVRFKQLGVLMDSKLSLTEKWKEINNLENENNTRNDEAWNRVKAVKAVKDFVTEAVGNINAKIEASSNIAERTIMNNPVSGAAYTANEQAAKDWFTRNIPEADFKKVYPYDIWGYTYENMFKMTMEGAANDVAHGFYDNFTDAFKENVKSKGFNVNDAIITKGGKVIKTAPDDNIFAFKNLGGIAPTPRAEPVITVNNTRSTQSTRAPVTVQFGDVSITVPDGSTAEDAQRLGTAAAEGFASGLALELSTSLLREGA